MTFFGRFSWMSGRFRPRIHPKASGRLVVEGQVLQRHRHAVRVLGVLWEGVRQQVQLVAKAEQRPVLTSTHLAIHEVVHKHSIRLYIILL